MPPTVWVCAPASSSASGTKLASNSATNASIAASDSEASAITPSSPPTAITSPAEPILRRRSPDAVASTAPVVFSVSTSHSSSPGLTSAPSSTSQSSTRPSVIERPHFGIPSLLIMPLLRVAVPGHTSRSNQSASLRHRRSRSLADRRGDPLGRRHVRVLEDRRERHRRVRRRDHPRRRLQLGERLAGDERDDVGGPPAARPGLVDDDEPPGALDALEDRVLVERRGRARIDDLALDPLAGQLLGRLLREPDHAAERDDRHVAALAHDARLAERDRVALLGHVALERVEDLV